MSEKALESTESEVKPEVPVLRAKTLPLAPLRPNEVPEFVPARMVNELLYCPRLMYLEWVQSEWADNRFTVEGKVVHRRVDQKSQQLKTRVDDESEGLEKPYEARSVWLTSERLRLTAKIDVVEVDGGSVVPIEYKRGKVPEYGPYLPERAQVAAQVMLLREHGYRCEGGEIYYAAERRRVPIGVNEELTSCVERTVAKALRLVEEGLCPPPLVNDPKCRGCSLAGICLPDEVTRVKEYDPNASLYDRDGPDYWGILEEPEEPKEPTRPIRRLFPPNDERVPLYVQDAGSRLGLDGDRLMVTGLETKPFAVRISNTSSVTLYGNVQVSTPALHRLMEEGIPVFFASSGGWYLGRATGPDPKNVELRAAQYQATTNKELSLRFAKAFTKTKIQNSRTILRRNHRASPNVALFELKQHAAKVDGASSVESLLGLEGSAARSYFQEFGGMLKPGLSEVFQFERRNRRPPTDPVNALLSFCYSLLTRETVMAAHAAGLDPQLGFYHQPRFGRPSLALDLMEEFRPVLADSTVINVLNNGIVNEDDFVHGNGAAGLKPSGRKAVIQAMERRLEQQVTHPIFEYRLSYRRVLEVQARLLARTLLGEIEEYPGFRVR